MNCGAKVFEDWLLVLCEFDLCLICCNGARVDAPRGENDWLRLCAAGFDELDGGVKTADFGLVLGNVGPGEGEAESLSKGLLRQRALPEAAVDMLLNHCKCLLHYDEMNVKYVSGIEGIEQVRRRKETPSLRSSITAQSARA